ncbi:MAG: hypothetical protein QNJ90_01440 [Planctomycetota bacterium]|nr:hypothetical protein [Planctomycetota bacterium]
MAASSTRRSALRVVGWILLALGLLAWPVARAVDAAWGTDVTLLSRLRTAEEREAWRRGGWDPATGLPGLYGVKDARDRVRLVGVEEERLVRPEEDPTQALLLLDARGGQGLLRARELRFRAALIGLALGLLGTLLLLRARRLSRASRTSPPAPPR